MIQRQAQEASVNPVRVGMKSAANQISPTRGDEMRNYRMQNLDASRFRWIPKDDLLTRIMKCVKDFTTVFVNLELDHEQVEADTAASGSALTAMIGFSGDFHGVVWVRCSEPLAERIAVGMWGNEPHGTDHNVRRALVEMVSIIGEDIKRFLSPQGRGVTLSIASVLRDDELCGPDLIGCPESLLCSFLHQGERLLVGMTVKKSL